MLICSLEDCVANENNTYVGLTATTLSRRFTMHLNDSSSKALHLKTHSIPKSKFRKILVENTTIIAQEINKLRLQILEALHIKTKNLESIELISKIATMFWNAYISLWFSISIDGVRFFLNALASQVYPTLRSRHFGML